VKEKKLREYVNIFPFTFQRKSIRELIGFALAVYSIAIAFFLPAIYEIQKWNLEKTVFQVSGLEVTNLMLLAVLSVASLVIVASISYAL
jgi:hypothetical protein